MGRYSFGIQAARLRHGLLAGLGLGAPVAFVAALPGEVAAIFHGVVDEAVGDRTGQTGRVVLSIRFLRVGTVGRTVKGVSSMVPGYGRAGRPLGALGDVILGFIGAGVGAGNQHGCQQNESGVSYHFVLLFDFSQALGDCQPASSRRSSSGSGFSAFSFGRGTMAFFIPASVQPRG